MSSTDDILARRRLRRKVTFWRVAAVLAALIAAAAWLARPWTGGDYVARVEVAGAIFDDPERDRLLRAIARDERARALVLRINSPGGTVAGSEALYAAVRDVAARKPVAALMGETAASGGYVAALGADRIFARGGTLTGSIGVVAHYPHAEELLDKIGVEVERVASGALKAEPSPFREPDPAALAAQAKLVEDSYDWFLGLVAERRDLAPERARALGDGRVFTGRQAVEAGLVDAVGGEPEARRWLAEARGVPASLKVRDAEPDEEFEGLFDLLGRSARGAAVEALGLGPRLMAIMR